MPHVPGQGSPHFWFKQASFWRHSELITHSGRQVGGLPINPSTQEHTAWSFISRHLLFGPHGVGWHGFCGACTKIGFNNYSICYQFERGKMTYVESVSIVQMHCLPFLMDNCTLVCDLLSHTMHCERTFQDTDFYIYSIDKLYLLDSHCLVHIQDDIRHTDLLEILLNMNKSHWDIVH